MRQTRLVPLTAYTLVALALPALATRADAQSCLGFPSFATNHLQMNAGATLSSDVEQFGASVVSGSNSFFAGFGVGGTSYGGGSPSLDLRGTLGSQTSSSSGRVQACPLLSVGYGFGPKDFEGAGFDANTLTAGFGLAFGAELGTALIPSLRLGYEYEQFKVSGVAGTTNDSFGSLAFALGYKFSDALVIRPSVGLTTRAGAEGEPTYGVSVAFNYGRRR